MYITTAATLPNSISAVHTTGALQIPRLEELAIRFGESTGRFVACRPCYTEPEDYFCSLYEPVTSIPRLPELELEL